MTDSVLAQCEGRGQLKELICSIMDHPKRGLPFKRGSAPYNLCGVCKHYTCTDLAATRCCLLVSKASGTNRRKPVCSGCQHPPVVRCSAVDTTQASDRYGHEHSVLFPPAPVSIVTQCAEQAQCQCTQLHHTRWRGVGVLHLRRQRHRDL